MNSISIIFPQQNVEGFPCDAGMESWGHEEAEDELYDISDDERYESNDDGADGHQQETGDVFLNLGGRKHQITFSQQLGLHVAKDVAGKDKKYESCNEYEKWAKFVLHEDSQTVFFFEDNTHVILERIKQDNAVDG